MWTQKALVTGDVMSTCGVDGIVDRTNMERMTQCGAGCYGVQHAQCCNVPYLLFPWVLDTAQWEHQRGMSHNIHVQDCYIYWD
jgi:hypothetical protein